MKLFGLITAFFMAALVTVCVQSPSMAQNKVVTATINATVPSGNILAVTSGGNVANLNIPSTSPLWQFNTTTGDLYTTAPVSANLTSVSNKSKGVTINIKATALPAVAGGSAAILTKFRLRLINATRQSGPASWSFTPTNYTLNQITATDQVIGTSTKQGRFTVDLALDVPSAAPITADIVAAGAVITATLVLTSVEN